ncbi:hypothetical protein [Xenorhabdus sp. SGI240]|uniref:hypothetical protein n=1 Tax=Xenorhabdus sp. SGI240 TaxID=3158262 RepID=UPI0032B7132D
MNKKKTHYDKILIRQIGVVNWAVTNFRATIRMLVAESWEMLMDLLLNEDNDEVSAIKKI